VAHAGGRPLPQPLRRALDAAGVADLAELSRLIGFAPQALRGIRGNPARRLTPERCARAAALLGVSPERAEQLLVDRGPP
jgi:hypothetical protein